MELWIPVIFFFLANGCIVSFVYGKLSERVAEQRNKQDTFCIRSEKTHGELFDLIRKHETNDQDHFGDDEAHWGKYERQWLNKRFEEMAARFDTQDVNIKRLLDRSQRDKEA